MNAKGSVAEDFGQKPVGMVITWLVVRYHRATVRAMRTPTDVDSVALPFLFAQKGTSLI